MKLNLGGGDDWKEPGWENVELAFGHDLNTDLLTKFGTNVVELIFFSHCLEHIAWKNVPLLLSDCHRVLVPRGTMRIIVPDVDKMWDISKNERRDVLLKSAPDFYGKKGPNFSVKAEMEKLLGFHGKNDFLNRKSGHNSFYNVSSLSLFLRAAGFEKITHSSFSKSDVEELQKGTEWNQKGMPINGFDNSLVECISLYMECVK